MAAKNIIDKIISRSPDRVGVYPRPDKELLAWFRDIRQDFKLKPYIEISEPDRFINQNYYL